MTDAVKPVYKVADINGFAKKYPQLVKVKKERVVTETYTLNQAKIARAVKLGITPEGVDIEA